MASTPAYADFTQYKARQPADDTQQERIGEVLVAASRYLDRKLNCMPGGFGPLDDLTLRFWAMGTRVLWLRNEEGLICPLRTVVADGIRPDFDFRGDYDNTAWKWDLDATWLHGIPDYAEAVGVPYRALGILPYDNAQIGVWPAAGAAVRIEGNWGWASVPSPIRELTIYLARAISDSHQGGAGAIVGAFDEAIQVTDQARRFWRSAMSEYSYGSMSKIGVY